jgi:AraC family transcriptional regulator
MHREIAGTGTGAERGVGGPARRCVPDDDADGSTQADGFPAAGRRDADRTGALLRVFTGTVPHGRTATIGYARHRFVFPLASAPVRATCHRRGAVRALEIPRGGCAAVPAGSQIGWTFAAPFRLVAVEVAPDILRGFAETEMRMLVAGNRIDGRLTLRARELGPLARRLGRAAGEEGPGTDVLLDALSRVFLVTLIREYALPDATPARFGRKLSAARFAELQETIRSGLGGRLHVPDLAAAVGMSESALARALRAAVGRTPAQLVREARLRRACEMLEGGDEPVAAIADACGFSDQAHLARSFRAAFGATPLAHRRAAKARHTT